MAAKAQPTSHWCNALTLLKGRERDTASYGRIGNEAPVFFDGNVKTVPIDENQQLSGQLSGHIPGRYD